jgi:hypothetical protein
MGFIQETPRRTWILAGTVTLPLLAGCSGGSPSSQTFTLHDIAPDGAQVAVTTISIKPGDFHSTRRSGDVTTESHIAISPEGKCMWIASLTKDGNSKPFIDVSVSFQQGEIRQVLTERNSSGKENIVKLQFGNAVQHVTVNNHVVSVPLPDLKHIRDEIAGACNDVARGKKPHTLDDDFRNELQPEGPPPVGRPQRRIAPAI